MRSEPKFYLKDNNASNNTPIILNLKVHKKPFRYSTQKSIIPELWDKNTQRPTKDRTILNEYKKFVPTLKEDLKDIENRLINLDKDVRHFFNLVEQQGKAIDFKELRAYLDDKYKIVVNAKPEIKPIEFNEYIELFLKGIEKGDILINSGVNFGKKYKPSTIKTWKEWHTQLKEFQKYYGKLKWNNITLDLYNEVVHYFYEKNYSVNTVGKVIKNIKSIMRRAYEEGYHKNEIFRAKDFKVLKEEIDKVTLTFDELQRIYDLDLPKDAQLRFHRDILLIGCYTALRISDIVRLNKAHFKKNADKTYLHIRMEKTEGKVVIPINSKLDKVLKQYDYEISKININNFRKDVKELCKLAGIVEPVEIKSSKGGKISYLSKPKYEFVSSHTGRRTGATLMFLSGINVTILQKITGHKKANTLLNYINVSQEKIAELVSNNTFFQ